MVLFVRILRTVNFLSGLRFQLKDSSTKAQNDFDTRESAPRKVPFYSHISMGQIQLYQSYFDHAVKLSSTLEFKQNDLRFNKLLAEAAIIDSLSEMDLELMRLQFVYANKNMREKHRSCWVETVLKRGDTDFFPDPWAIVSAVFS